MEKFEAKMHSSTMRIDGLTDLLNKHRTFVGQSVTLEVDPEKPGILKVRFGGAFDEKQPIANSIESLPDTNKVSDDVSISFNMVLEKVESKIAELNHQGAKAFENGKYEIARDLLEKASRMKNY